MENTRPTKEISLATGHVVVLNEYITGRDKRTIQAAYMEQAKITQKADAKTGQGEIEIGGVSGSVNDIMQDLAFKAVIAEIRPATKEGAEAPAPIKDRQKIVDFVLDLPEAEYNEVVKAVNEITDPKKA